VSGPERKEGYIGLGEIEQVIEKVHEWLKAGRKVCIATVIEARGSTPRGVGAKMGLSSTGETSGTVGGGAVEKKVLDRASDLLRTGGTAVVEFDLSGKSADLDSVCGGNLRVFLEAVGEYRRLFVMGAGHVGRALAKVADATGFAVTLVDDREDFLTGEGLPPSVRLVNATPGNFESLLDMGEESFAVIATRGHALDREWLAALSGLDLRYVGMVGSARKIESVYSALREEGVPQDFLDRVHAPVGLEIEAETPEEIAVSILAEIIKVWREGARP
jgi:xanthine dehydrogenase accessory factor